MHSRDYSQDVVYASAICCEFLGIQLTLEIEGIWPLLPPTYVLLEVSVFDVART